MKIMNEALFELYLHIFEIKADMVITILKLYVYLHSDTIISEHIVRIIYLMTV